MGKMAEGGGRWTPKRLFGVGGDMCLEEEG